MKMIKVILAGALMLPIAAWCQDAPPSEGHPGMHHRGPDEGFHMGPMGGKWWKIPEVQQKLNLTADQQQKMDNVFQQTRPALITLRANIQTAEAALEPLLSADQPNDAQILAQVDQVAQARAELEKQTARMLLAMRHTLTTDQWKTLQSMHEQHRLMMRHRGGEGPGAPPPPPQNE